MDIEVDKLLRWRWVEIRTASGIERARMARPTFTFWQLWRARKQQLRALGIRVKRNRHSGCYVIYLHDVPQPVPHWTDAA